LVPSGKFYARHGGVNLSIMYVIVDRAVWSTEAVILSITYC